MYELLHAGFDTLDVAIQGALPFEQLATLKEARDQAAARQEAVLTWVGPGNTPIQVLGHGMRGGYAVVGDTGPIGAQWRFKDNGDPREWNVFVSPHARMLLAYGYPAVWEKLRNELLAMGGQIVDHALNRVDFAMDFKATGFELRADQVVAPANTKVHPHWDDKVATSSKPSAVFRGRRIESVTIGKQPGRQVIIYDKKREAMEKQNKHWFWVWGLDHFPKDVDVWRIEIRAGKKELKEKYKIRRFDDFEAAIGDVVFNALQDVRYVADAQSDSNVSRYTLHPLWIACERTAGENLLKFRSGLTPDQLLTIERKEALERYRALLIGNAAGLAVSLGLEVESIMEDLPKIAEQELSKMLTNETERVRNSITRSNQRLHFLR